MLWTLIIGGIAGFIGSLLFKGTGSGIIINIVLGILGGWFGGWIFGQLGFTGPGYFFTAVIEHSYFVGSLVYSLKEHSFYRFI